jgi:hypothetical protein
MSAVHGARRQSNPRAHEAHVVHGTLPPAPTVIRPRGKERVQSRALRELVGGRPDRENARGLGGQGGHASGAARGREEVASSTRRARRRSDMRKERTAQAPGRAR